MDQEKLIKILEKSNIRDEEELERILKLATRTIDKNVYKERRLPINDEVVTFGVITDLHIGHIEYRPDILRHAIKNFKQNNVSFVVNSGDTIEGMSGREGHIYELTHIGASNQFDYFRNEFKLFEEAGLNVYSIEAANSHSGWYKSKANMGLDVGKEMEATCKSYYFLGYDDIDLLIGDTDLRIKLVHPGGGSAYALCFDDKTEIMTENGWVLFKDYNRKDKVATLNIEKDEFEWQDIDDYYEYDYEGKMFHFKSRNIDSMITPDHNMLVKRYSNNLLQSRKYDWKLIKAKELKEAKKEWQLKKSCQNWQGEYTDYIEIPYRESKTSHSIKHVGKVKIEDIAELIAWYVTKGYIRKSMIEISQYESVNKENLDDIKNLFERIGLDYKLRNNKDEIKGIKIYCIELVEWLISQCGSDSKNKYLPKWLKNQPKNVLQIVFDTMLRGNGYINNKGFNYRSINKRLLEDFAEIALKLGYGVTFNKDKINISNFQTLPIIKNKPQVIDYNGKIYCVSVPNRVIMVRRNGKTVWSGNSYKMQKLVNSLQGGHKPNIVIQGHYHKANYMFYRNIHCIDAGTLQNQSSFMRKIGTPAHTGYWIVKFTHDGESITSFTPTFIPFYN